MVVDYGKYFPLESYYRKVVMPISKRFKFGSSGRMVCCLHNDHDPSLGVVKTSKGEVYHCFGCNAWGNVVDLHKKVSRKYFSKFLSEEEAVKDLCRLFSVNFESVPKVDEYIEDDDIRREVEMLKAQEKFDYSDFKEGMLMGKRRKQGVSYFNMLMMTIINEINEGKEND